jgi:hypothetical protein
MKRLEPSTFCTASERERCSEPKGGHRIRSAAYGLPMRRPFVWASLLLAVAVMVGLVLQLYFIAA